MVAPNLKREVIEVPLELTAGNKFGRYNKISAAQTWNFIVSDGWLVTTAGYTNVLTLGGNSPGRAIFNSIRGGFLVMVWGSIVYTVKLIMVAGEPVYDYQFIGNLSTTLGDVFIAENNNYQIAITDLNNIYVYQYRGATTGFFVSSYSESPSTSPFLIPIHNPGYISFQNSRLIVADTSTNNWYLSNLNNALDWPNTAAFIGSVQTKPDLCQACVPMPGSGNVLMVFGKTVVEQWQDIGAAIFPYQKASTFNIDYGCLNASSISALDNHIVWLAANEQSGATLMVYSGGVPKQISTDGMDFKFAELSNPTNCTGFLYRQDGHLLYQFTFPDDNLSYLWDFETQQFFTVTDENLNYHIARNVVFYQNDYYFVSLNGGNLYEFGTQYYDYDYGNGVVFQCPRIVISPPIRLPSQRPYIAQDLSFTIEQGQENPISTNNTTNPTNAITTASASVDLYVSRNGAQSFSSAMRMDMYPTGDYASLWIYRQLGRANDFTSMLRFNGFGRFIATNGIVRIYE